MGKQGGRGWVLGGGTLILPEALLLHSPHFTSPQSASPHFAQNQVADGQE